MALSPRRPPDRERLISTRLSRSGQGRSTARMGHGLPRHHRPGKVRSRFSEETFAGVSSRDGVAPSGRSRAKWEPMKPTDSGYPSAYADSPADNNVVAGAKLGMIPSRPRPE